LMQQSKVLCRERRGRTSGSQVAMMARLEQDQCWQGAEHAQEEVLVDLVRNRAGHADVGGARRISM
jgi:hypothetical protein